MKLRHCIALLFSALWLVTAASGQSRPTPSAPVNPDLRAGIRTLDLEPVWSGHPVGFALLTHGDRQFVAFYDASRRMTIAQRTLGQRQWSYTTLPSTVGWDSHNYIAMELDRDGYLHVAGNMHASPLVYFRGTRPYNAASLVRVPSMTGRHEERVTYPVFSYAPDGELLFQYRSGSSGAGDTYRNRYDERTKTWHALTGQPLFFGGNRMNAYPLNPVKGPDSWYHQVWVWRDTPMAETNHDLSYARSRDLIHWETANGVPLTLPLTIDTPGLVVDPSPPRGGLLNGTQAVGFDALGNLVISYLKYDATGNTQLYFARWQGAHWLLQQASNWNYRWDFHGGGSLVNEIHIGPLRASGGKLTIAISHKVYGSGVWEVDPATMRLQGKLTADASVDEGSEDISGASQSGLLDRSASDSAGTRADGVTYRLTWKTLPQNRDQPRPEGAPPPSMLRLVLAN
ncbi:MAG: BNR repeat-containing protein [Acidobacteriaceae bacterium]